MIGLSKLYCGSVEASDALRYGRGHAAPGGPAASAIRKPVVVWNCTERCNLRCIHCYSRSCDQSPAKELTTAEGFALLDDLARFGCPVVLFSGGEPLLREDLFDLIARSRQLALRAVVSTNGTQITPAVADRLHQAGVGYVGISLDGLRSTHDAFRGEAGAFDRAMAGIRNCRDAGVKVGLRLTLHRRNAAELDDIFDLIEAERIPRACFYHLVYAGRGADLMAEDLDHSAARRAVDRIIDRTAALHRQGRAVEILTVDNHADGPYLYLRMLREGNPRAADVLRLLRANGGNSSGRSIAAVSWDGRVHPDQFWRHVSLGNVRQRPFSAIWSDMSHPLLAALSDRRSRIKGRCATCTFFNVCGGNFRVRAEAATGDLWGADPACYLRDDEIAPTKPGDEPGRQDGK